MRHDSVLSHPSHPNGEIALDVSEYDVLEFLSDDRLPPLYRRVWILILMAEAERCGLTPIDDVRLHQLAYLANCLAPVYDLTAPDRTVLKADRGFFSSVVQWDIDRLVVQGLVEMTEFEPSEDVAGKWFTATYVLGQRGRSVSDECCVGVRMTTAKRYLSEVVAAYEPLSQEVRDNLPNADALYADAAAVPGMLIDFGEWVRPREQNFSFRATLAFETGPQPKLSSRDRVHLYLRYLARVRRRAG